MAKSNNNHWKIIFLATIFNLLFEYSLRGIRDLVTHPILPVLLFTIYFTYFTLVEDLIIRFRFKDYHLLFVSFTFGTIAQFLISGTALDSSGAFGINWGRFLFVNLVWWGALQTILALYLANRFASRNWSHKKISITGWGFRLVLFLVIIIIFRLSGIIPPISPTAFRTMLILLIISLLPLRFLSRKAYLMDPFPFRKSWVMDIFGLISVLIFVVNAVFLAVNPSQVGASVVGVESLRFVTLWTVILGLIMLGYRIISKREISI